MNQTNPEEISRETQVRLPERKKVAAKMIAEQIADLLNWTREEERAEAVRTFSATIEEGWKCVEPGRRFDMNQLIEDANLN
jgi:hypothetical protein